MDQFCYENVLQEEIGGSRMRRYSIEEEKLHNSFADGDKTNQTLKGYNGAQRNFKINFELTLSFNGSENEPIKAKIDFSQKTQDLSEVEKAAEIFNPCNNDP